MSRKEKKGKRKEKDEDEEKDEDGGVKRLKEETLRAIFAVVFFVFGVFFLLSAFGKGGVAGEKSYIILHDNLFGVGYYILPLLFFILCISFFRTLHKKLALTHSIGGLLFFASSLSLININLPGKGGLVGNFISLPLLNLFDKPVSIVILLAFLLISILIIFDAPIRLNFVGFLWNLLFKKKEVAEEVANLVKGIMENVVTLRVPVQVGISINRSWGEMK